MKTIIINAMIVTGNVNNDVYESGCMIFENDLIIYVGVKKDFEFDKFDRVIDVKGNIVMPGLVNTHSHAGMSLLRGYGDDLPLKEWLEQKMWPIEARFKEEHVRIGTELAVLEMLKSGTTTFADFYNYMDIVAGVVKTSGIRARLSRGMIGHPSSEVQEQKLKNASLFIDQWENQADGRIKTMISPHSPYTCSPDFIQDILEVAIAKNVPIHIHMSETIQEVQLNVQKYGRRPVQHLKELGVFENSTLVAHAVHVNQDEIEILKTNDVKISHNPGSNLKLGSGIAPVPEMIRAGIHVSLGTDSAASNNNLDMFEEMRLVSLIHKGYYQDPLLIPAKLALRMATLYGAESLFWEKEIGSLDNGKKADFLIINKQKPHFYPLYDVISQLVYSSNGHDVNDVFVNGVQLVKDGNVLTLDEERILYEADEITKYWK